MNIVLQKHKSKQTSSIPDGLDELSADIGREVINNRNFFKLIKARKKFLAHWTSIHYLNLLKVIRNKPENVYKFIRDYQEALIIARKNILGNEQTYVYIIAIKLLLHKNSGLS